MAKYNIETLSFLIGSFRDIIQSFGQNSKSVDFYKRQVSQLVSIGQIGIKEADLVEEVIGMQNTNAVKWENASKKLEQFIFAIEETYGINNESQIILMLENMEKGSKISEQVKNIVYKVYGIDTSNIITKRNNRKINFGSIPKNESVQSTGNTNKQPRPTVSQLNNQLARLKSVAGDAIIRVRNTEAVCSCDPWYRSCDIKDIEKSLYVLNKLAIKAEYEVGINKYDDNPCSRGMCFSSIPNEKQVRQLIDSIDWKEVYERASR